MLGRSLLFIRFARRAFRRALGALLSASVCRSWLCWHHCMIAGVYIASHGEWRASLSAGVSSYHNPAAGRSLNGLYCHLAQRRGDGGAPWCNFWFTSAACLLGARRLAARRATQVLGESISETRVLGRSPT
jgi:hypothetical protein